MSTTRGVARLDDSWTHVAGRDAPRRATSNCESSHRHRAGTNWQRVIVRLPAGTDLGRNRCLAVLTDKEIDGLRSSSLAEFRIGTEVFAPGDAIDHVLFPLDSMFSLALRPEAIAVECGTIGQEGMVGLDLLLGGRVAAQVAMCQISGTALCIPADEFHTLTASSQSFTDELLGFARNYVAQLSATVACNAVHDVRTRMCRWLLLARESVGRDYFDLTHEFLGQMLGVRRATVSAVAAELRETGAIRSTRGAIAISDGGLLETLSCTCAVERIDSPID